MEVPSKPLFIYDGTCGFCRSWVERWRAATGDRVDYAPYQEVGARFPEVPEERFRAAAHLIEPDGHVSHGAEAVFRALAYRRRGGVPLWLHRHLPGFAPASEAVYRFVAAHRPGLSRLTNWLWGRHVVPPGETITAWIFIRLLAAIYLVAFVSLGVQITGLAGAHGILPAREYLHAVGSRYGTLGYWVLPTIGWVNASDGFMVAMSAVGGLVSVALLLGAAPVACLIALWALYLSLSVLGQDFFWFQWDSLLLETGLLAVFLAPWRAWSRPSTDPAPSRIALWLLRWLLFRLSISSAAVKFLSGDPAWRDLTALRYHFETQPLPTWTAWMIHGALPDWVLRAGVVCTYLAEGAAPFLMFAPRRIRFFGAGVIATFQVMIMATGNYAFFNLLAIALCLLLLDDGVWPARWREGAPRASEGGGWSRWVVAPAALLLFLASLVPFVTTLGKPIQWLGPVRIIYGAIWPFRSVNRYGLFAVMTKRRPEIIVEGSADGVHWLPYEFRWKPGDLKKRPDFVEPHQPRLDWQIWFAALSDFRQQPWFLNFCRRLLEGRKPVLALLKQNPFPRGPPRYVRAVVYEYAFTDDRTRDVTGAWWAREPRGLYCPALALQNGELVAVPELSGE